VQPSNGSPGSSVICIVLDHSRSQSFHQAFNARINTASVAVSERFEQAAHFGLDIDVDLAFRRHQIGNNARLSEIVDFPHMSGVRQFDLVLSLLSIQETTFWHLLCPN